MNREEMIAWIAWFDKYIFQCSDAITQRKRKIARFNTNRPIIAAEADALAAENEILRTRPVRPGRGRP